MGVLMYSLLSSSGEIIDELCNTTAANYVHSIATASHEEGSVFDNRGCLSMFDLQILSRMMSQWRPYLSAKHPKMSPGLSINQLFNSRFDLSVSGYTYSICQQHIKHISHQLYRWIQDHGPVF